MKRVPLSGKAWSAALRTVVRQRVSGFRRGVRAAALGGAALLALFPCSAYGDEQVPAETALFLEGLEPEPSVAELVDFLEAYNTVFSSCRELDVYMKALEYLAEHGELDIVRVHLETLNRCGEEPEDAWARRP